MCKLQGIAKLLTSTTALSIMSMLAKTASIWLIREFRVFQQKFWHCMTKIWFLSNLLQICRKYPLMAVLQTIHISQSSLTKLKSRPLQKRLMRVHSSRNTKIMTNQSSTRSAWIKSFTIVEWRTKRRIYSRSFQVPLKTLQMSLNFYSASPDIELKQWVRLHRL